LEDAGSPVLGECGTVVAFDGDSDHVVVAWDDALTSVWMLTEIEVVESPRATAD
jgi:hypothetical protein